MSDVNSATAGQKGDNFAESGAVVAEQKYIHILYIFISLRIRCIKDDIMLRIEARIVEKSANSAPAKCSTVIQASSGRERRPMCFPTHGA